MITKHPLVIINSIKVSDLDEIRNVCFQEEHLRDIIFVTLRRFFFIDITSCEIWLVDTQGQIGVWLRTL